MPTMIVRFAQGDGSSLAAAVRAVDAQSLQLFVFGINGHESSPDSDLSLLAAYGN